jgi:hypothetical protein
MFFFYNYIYVYIYIHMYKMLMLICVLLRLSWTLKLKESGLCGCQFGTEGSFLGWNRAHRLRYPTFN